MSAVKGLAAAYDRPIVGIPTLEALASQADIAEGLICPMIDARRGEVYFAGFCFSNGILKLKIPTQAGALQKLLDDIQQPCTFVGNGAVLYQKEILNTLPDRALFATAALNDIRATTVARLARQRILEGDVDDIATLVPTYLRKSDAELNRSSG
jgi:tRNA threonylcarbamoyladenosine biosynthesis protein TsaB